MRTMRLLNMTKLLKYAFQSKVGQSANVSLGYLSNGLFLDEAEIDRYNQQMGSTLGASDIKYLNVSNMHGYGDDIVDGRLDVD